jgi:hypothetical protein
MHNQPGDITATETAVLLKRIQTFLHGQHIPALRQLKVEVSGDTAVIHGKVRTFYERQVGVECCKRVAGVRNVIDLITVATAREWRIPNASSVPVRNINPLNTEFLT